jgi:hypothetical protein
MICSRIRVFLILLAPFVLTGCRLVPRTSTFMGGMVLCQIEKQVDNKLGLAGTTASVGIHCWAMSVRKSLNSNMEYDTGF